MRSTSYGESAAVHRLFRACWLAGVLSALALLSGACSTGDRGAADESTEPSASSTPPDNSMKEPSTMPNKKVTSASERPQPIETVASAVPAATLNELIADVASQAGVARTQVNVIKQEALTWRDGSLGCPEPGMAYSQALIEGYHVVLSVNGEVFDMRASRKGRFSRCLNPTKPDPLRDDSL